MKNAVDEPRHAGPIVVVDDDVPFLRTLCLNLEDAGFRVVQFESGQAAVDYFAEGHSAAAMLLDWHMPNVDGPQVLERLRDSGARVPVLFLTGLHQPIYEEVALARGAVDFVEKSRSFQVILDRLKIVLGGAKASVPNGTPVAAPARLASNLELDEASARALWRGTRVDLTLTEFKVVRLLATRGARDVSYREIYDVMRGEGFRAGSGDEGYRANVRALIKRVRQKFKTIDANFTQLENYPGFGYRWMDDGQP